MEQRRLLLIITGVAVALAITIGAGLWLLYPRTQDNDTAEATGGVLEWEPLDYIQGDGSLPGIEDESASGFTGIDSAVDGEFIVTYGVAEETGEPTPEASEGLVLDDREGFSGSITRDTVQPATDPAEAEQAEPDIRVSRPAAATDSARSGFRATSTAPRTAAASPETSDTTDLSDRAYWIQVISSPNRDTVEQARITMDELQLGSRILTKDIGGTTYYRLRLGPFPIRTEAEKFLGWVHEVDGFADALIFVDYTTAVLAARAH